MMKLFAKIVDSHASFMKYVLYIRNKTFKKVLHFHEVLARFNNKALARLGFYILVIKSKIKKKK